MLKRKLGKSELELSVVGLGTWAIGGADWSYGWGAQSEKDSIDAINEALDSGVNWIDTAAVYGLGRSEEIVGKVLKTRKDPVIIATKCGLIGDSQRNISSSLKRASILAEIEASLKRLQIERIDLYQIHWPDPDPQIEEGLKTLLELKNQGKIAHIGVSNFSKKQLERAAKVTEIVSLQPPYSMLNREIEKEILPWCKENYVGVVAYSPLQCGLLTGKVTTQWVKDLPTDDWRRSKSPYFKEPALSKNLEVVARLKDLASQFDMTLSELAVSWCLRKSVVTSAIVGVRRKGQILDALGAGQRELNDEQIKLCEEALHFQ